MFFFFVMFDDAVSQFEQGEYIQRLLPGMLLTSVTFGSIPMAVALQNDLQSQMFERLRSMPVWPYALLFSRLAFEGVRVLLASLVLLGMGLMLGFQLHPDPLSLFTFVGVLLLASVSFSCVSFFTAIYSRSTEFLSSMLTAIYLCAIFTSLSMGPVSAFPEWIQWVVMHNPLSLFVEAMRMSSLGTPCVSVLASVVAASAALLAVFGCGSFILFNKRFYNTNFVLNLSSQIHGHVK